MISTKTFLAFAILLAGAAVASNHRGKEVHVPKGKPVILDGQISDEEWKGAYKEELVGGGEIRLLQDGSDLYVGVKGLKEGWSHVYVTTGESIHVLHASAALGEATYRQEKPGLWQPVKSFSWSMRQRDQSEETARARGAFFTSNGWVANNNLMGSSVELEFKIGPKLLTGGDVRLAAVYAIDAKSPQYWPRTLADDSLKAELIYGNTPADLKFNQANWARLKFSGKFNNSR